MVYSHTRFTLNGLCNASLLKTGSWSTTNVIPISMTRLPIRTPILLLPHTARFLTIRVPLVFCTLFRYAENALHTIEATISHQFPLCRLHLYQCAAVLFVSLGIRGTKRNIMNGLHLWFFSLVFFSLILIFLFF